MQAVTTIGLDIAKSVFRVHGVDAQGNVVVRRQLKRRHVVAFFEKLSPCLVGLEACASSHHWSRELQALGHRVRLMPPAYVKPYVKRQKNDAAEAEAICEAVTRANMRFVPTKTTEQQSCLTLHRTRHLFIRQQTAVINAIRAHLAEFGVVAPVGRKGIEELLNVVADPNDMRLPKVARACLAALGAQLCRCKEQILEFDRMIMAWHRSSEMSKRLDEIPGVGPALATALVATVADPSAFRSGRNFSAWIGLVPKQHSIGGKERLGSISKQGDSLPARPVHGRCTRRHPLCQDLWHQASALAHSVVGQAANEGRGHRARQQDRTHRLGDDGQGRALQGTRCACSVNEIASGIRRDVKVGRANST
jgi:transposase